MMQPYFYPYAGYFRLLAAADTFVIFDDVQFPRRGRVHRCAILAPSGASEWLTLPLARVPRDVLIGDLTFAAAARPTFDARLARLPWLMRGAGPLADRVRAHLFGSLGTPSDFLGVGLRLVAEELRLPARFVLSSTLQIDRSLRGHERVIAVVEAVGGCAYVNAPGGRSLYRRRDFEERGIALRFLKPYCGQFRYLLPALLEHDAETLRADILDSTSLTE